MEEAQDSILFLSSHPLFQELRQILNSEAEKRDSPWIKIDILRQAFLDKNDVSLESVIDALGYRDSLRKFLTKSKHFSIYSTQVQEDFYLAPPGEVMPAGKPKLRKEPTQQIPTQQPPRRPLVKRSWWVDGRLVRMLKEEYSQDCARRYAKNTSGQKSMPRLRFGSVDHLEQALIKMIQHSTLHQRQGFISLETLGAQFYARHGRSIKAVIETLHLDIQPVELLQANPAIRLERVKNNWRITLAE